jgi:hypothetical protein
MGWLVLIVMLSAAFAAGYATRAAISVRRRRRARWDAETLK